MFSNVGFFFIYIADFDESAAAIEEEENQFKEKLTGILHFTFWQCGIKCENSNI